jgi:ParB family chromosome partitioning protein
MAEFKTLPLDKILVPANRLRKVNENKAFLIGQSVKAGELIHPVTVYATPNGERPYTLAAGATRYRGHELHGLKEIEVLVRKLDKAGARRVEVEENLFRDELTKLERALHVIEYRRLWEEEHGAIDPKGGRPREGNSAKLAEFSGDNAQNHFFAQALDDLGLSRRAIERAQFIGGKLQPELREVLRDTGDANNQQLLEKLAGMEPQRQKKVAKVYAEQPDIKRAIDLTDQNAKAKAVKTVQNDLLDRLVSTWDRADDRTKAEFIDHIQRKAIERRGEADGVEIDPRQVTIFDLIAAQTEGAAQ